MKHEIDLSKYQVHTDLISETINTISENTGYVKEEEQIEDVTIETITIDKQGEELIQKKSGVYKTLYFEDVTDEKNYKVVQTAFQKALQQVLQLEKIPKKASCLVVGLGNHNATPDALGPLAGEQVLVTRHLFQLGLEVDEKYRSVAVFIPGVMGTTGMETKDMILGIFNEIKPDFIIALDALAASHLERLNKTIQITNTGIHPGSGIGNHRSELSKDTLGVPVIAIGVPTVVDAVTIVSNTIDYLFEHISYEKENANQASLKFVSPMHRDYEEQEDNLTLQEKETVMGLVGKLSDEQIRQLIAEVLMPLGYNLIVTPKDVNFVIEKLSKLLATGINKSLHAN